MKLSSTLFAVIALNASVAFARPTVTVTQFENRITNGPCSLDRTLNLDLKNTLARQIIGIFANHADLRIMNLERSKSPLPSQYVVTGTVRSFDQCKTRNPREQTVRIAMDMRVIDTRSGRVAYTFTSSANAVGEGSTLDQTANVVLYDLANRVERALISRKGMVHIVDRRTRKVASRDMTVRLVKKGPYSR